MFRNERAHRLNRADGGGGSAPAADGARLRCAHADCCAHRRAHRHVNVNLYPYSNLHARPYANSYLRAPTYTYPNCYAYIASCSLPSDAMASLHGHTCAGRGAYRLLPSPV